MLEITIHTNLTNCEHCFVIHKGCSKRIQASVVILTIGNLLQCWTNPNRNNILVTRCTYASSFSIAQNTCGSQFCDINKSCCVVFRFVISTSSNLSPSRKSFILEHQKSYKVQGWENMEVSARVGFCLWLRNVAKSEASTLVRCRVGFASPLYYHFTGHLTRIPTYHVTQMLQNL
jgi:hypothetical protein